MEETDRIVESIRENAKTMKELVNGGKQPDHKTLLKHVISDETILGNMSGHSEMQHHDQNVAEIGALDADVTELEKIRSVGNVRF